MKRVLVLVFLSAAFGCATTPVATSPVTTPQSATPITPQSATPITPASAAPVTPAAAADATSAGTAPCDPGMAQLNAALWMQSSAEYRGIALQTFTIARHALDAALNNPFAKGALEETSNDPSQPPAVILDLDETVLDNTPFGTRMIRAHKTYEPEAWKQWTSEGAALAIPGALEFLQYAKSRGVTLFYVTNRKIDEEAGTRANLVKLGYPLDANVDTLLMQGENGWTSGDKSPRRAHVAAKYRILLLLGDDLNDFATASGKTIEERNAIIDSVRSWWGETWFLLPNAMYGSWERALTGDSGGSPCEQLQRKVEALR